MCIAAITHHLVAIIAGFARIDSTVAAGFNLTHPIAAVADIDVAIVAALDTCTQHAVAAGGMDATVQARIGIDPVAVIAGFKTCNTDLEIDPLNSITARGSDTIIAARIGLYPVAVIAGFTVIDTSVTAAL